MARTTESGVKGRVVTGRTLRLGTRGSALARWQTEQVRDRLQAVGARTLIEEIRTTGDDRADVPLWQIGSVALFTRQLDEALLAGRIDLAVHSLKDLPSKLPDGIAIVAVGEREDPRDAFIGRQVAHLAELPTGAVIATSSVRRRAQLLHHRPDLHVVDIRGNVDTRLRLLETTAAWGATLLAAAGVIRLGLVERIGEYLDPAVMLPAPGQGAIAVTARTEDAEIRVLLESTMHHENTGLCVTAERALLRVLDGGCQVPIAALAEREGNRLTLRSRVLSHDGTTVLEDQRTAAVSTPEAAQLLGESAAHALVSAGAESVLRDARRAMSRE